MFLVYERHPPGSYFNFALICNKKNGQKRRKDGFDSRSREIFQLEKDWSQSLLFFGEVGRAAFFPFFFFFCFFFFFRFPLSSLSSSSEDESSLMKSSMDPSLSDSLQNRKKTQKKTFLFFTDRYTAKKSVIFHLCSSFYR